MYILAYTCTPINSDCHECTNLQNGINKLLKWTLDYILQRKRVFSMITKRSKTKIYKLIDNTPTSILTNAT